MAIGQKASFLLYEFKTGGEARKVNNAFGPDTVETRTGGSVNFYSGKQACNLLAEANGCYFD